MLAEEHHPVAVVVERRAGSTPWAEDLWVPVAVLPGETAAAPWTVLRKEKGLTAYIAGSTTVSFFSSETPNYKSNLESGAPVLWVVLRPSSTPPGMELVAVLADPGEAEAMTTAGSDVIETVPMPGQIREALEAFVAAHHVERGFHKRKRDRADPESLGVRRRVARDV
ncbi:DUF3305 domain-containing protein [Elioraea tepida]|jgi:hypothetical protein|uniref:DUF3305 domain-containing protein n=1 Tax=Elioraea tepida TaxID=2843330 RepID=A0A975YKT9_9PROT|nr:DUF3305 domain-containing protein [Elioraea tepida]QXM25807.1 DUF3305 domain-containing protein [Elioraea tepida]